MLIMPPPEYGTQIEVASSLAKKELNLSSALSGPEWVIVIGLGFGLTLWCCKLLAGTFFIVFKKAGVAAEGTTNSRCRKKRAEDKLPQIVTTASGEIGVVVKKLDSITFELVVPELTPVGDLDYWKSVEWTSDLKILGNRDASLVGFQKTATLVVERVAVNEHLQQLKSDLQMAQSLQGSVPASEIHQAKASYFKQAEQRLKIAIANAEALLQEQDYWIRVSLIAIRLSRVDEEIERMTDVSDRIQKLKEQYWNTEEHLDAHRYLKQ